MLVTSADLWGTVCYWILLVFSGLIVHTCSGFSEICLLLLLATHTTEHLHSPNGKCIDLKVRSRKHCLWVDGECFLYVNSLLLLSGIFCCMFLEWELSIQPGSQVLYDCRSLYYFIIDIKVSNHTFTKLYFTPEVYKFSFCWVHLKSYPVHPWSGH